MTVRAKILAYWLSILILEGLNAPGQAQDASEGWLILTEAYSSIVASIQPQELPENSLVMVWSGDTLVDAAAWNGDQPFVKQYLIEPGRYSLHAVGQVEPTEFNAEPGLFTSVGLEFRGPPEAGDEFLPVKLLVLEGNVPADQAWSVVSKMVHETKAGSRPRVSYLELDDERIVFGIRSPYPNPIPTPNPGPEPQPRPQPGEKAE